MRISLGVVIRKGDTEKFLHNETIVGVEAKNVSFKNET